MTHWKKLTNPDYLGAYSVMDAGHDLVLTIKNVKEELVSGTDGKKEQCVVAYFAEGCKPMILNKTNMKAIEKLYGTPFIEEWVGKRIQVYSARVKAFGETVDALRIRPTIPKAPVIKCEECGNDVKPAGKFTAEQVASLNKQRYGKVLCADCSSKLKAATNSEGDAKNDSDS